MLIKIPIDPSFADPAFEISALSGFTVTFARVFHD
jgi:hypothetical protein